MECGWAGTCSPALEWWVLEDFARGYHSSNELARKRRDSWPQSGLFTPHWKRNRRHLCSSSSRLHASSHVVRCWIPSGESGPDALYICVAVTWPLDADAANTFVLARSMFARASGFALFAYRGTSCRLTTRTLLQMPSPPNCTQRTRRLSTGCPALPPLLRSSSMW